MTYDIIIAVTNDLNSDQRMIRISNTYHESGKNVLLIGNEKTHSNLILSQKFDQLRIQTICKRGVFFYAEFNFRLLLKLIFSSAKKYYAVDLDTIVAVRLASLIRKRPFIFDSHEHFSEVPELKGKIVKKWIWERIGKLCVSGADKCITVGEELAMILKYKYKKQFQVVPNYPVFKSIPKSTSKPDKFILLYQGKINEGRGIRQMIDAIKDLSQVELWVVGDGDYYTRYKSYAEAMTYSDRIKFYGWKSPEDLHNITCLADLGINLLSPQSRSYYNSNANKFYDYIMAEVPVLTMSFPEYIRVNKEYDVAYLINDLRINTISERIKQITSDVQKHRRKKENCLRAKEIFCWREVKDLLLYD